MTQKEIFDDNSSRNDFATKHFSIKTVFEEMVLMPKFFRWNFEEMILRTKFLKKMVLRPTKLFDIEVSMKAFFEEMI